MANLRIAVVIASLLFCVAVQGATVYKAIAHIRPTSSSLNVTGTVTFQWLAANQVNVTVDVTGLTGAATSRGIHVHEYGDLTSTTAVGAHYNPLNKPHACPGTVDRHTGDMGNWDIVNGEIHQTKTLDLLELLGSNSIVGRAVVVHANTDDCADVQSAGAREGFGVIGIQNAGAADVNAAVFEMEVRSNRSICHLISVPGSNTAISGVVLFETTETGTTVSAQVSGLSSGKHGFHIHEFGDLTTGLTVGGHYNPYNKVHSLPGYDGDNRHVGDMGNIYYFETSTAFYKYNNNNLIKLSQANNVVGRAVVIHAMEDKCDVPSAGGRIAYCVIGVASPTTTFSIPSTVSATQDTAACVPPPPSAGASLTIAAAMTFFAALFASLF